jgi:hypothetical protein
VQLTASEKERASLESRTAALEAASTDAAQLKEWVVRAQKLEEQTTDLRSSHAGALLQVRGFLGSVKRWLLTCFLAFR